MAWWKRGARRRGAGDADAGFRRALIAVLDRELGEAETILADLVQRDSDAVEAYLALARLYRQRGEIGRGIHLHQNLLLRRELEPDERFDALIGLADDFREGGFLRRAIAAYEEVLAQSPRHPRALRALVGLLIDAREPKRAIPLARRLAKLEGREPGPAEADLWAEIAEAARSEGRTDEARKALSRALRRDRDHVRAWIALGEVEAELGHDKKALAAWKRVPQIDRRAGAKVYPRLAAAFAALDKAREHEEFLRGLLEEQPADAGSRLALARALSARGAGEEALDEVRTVLEREPENLDAHAALGRILLGEGREPEVRKAHEALLDVLERERVVLPGNRFE